MDEKTSVRFLFNQKLDFFFVIFPSDQESLLVLQIGNELLNEHMQCINLLFYHWCGRVLILSWYQWYMATKFYKINFKRWRKKSTYFLLLKAYKKCCQSKVTHIFASSEHLKKRMWSLSSRYYFEYMKRTSHKS